MGVVRCCRCGRHIDMDLDVEVFTNDDIPGLEENDHDSVCYGCLTEEELDRLEYEDHV